MTLAEELVEKYVLPVGKLHARVSLSGAFDLANEVLERAAQECEKLRKQLNKLPVSDECRPAVESALVTAENRIRALKGTL